MAKYINQLTKDRRGHYKASRGGELYILFLQKIHYLSLERKVMELKFQMIPGKHGQIPTCTPNMSTLYLIMVTLSWQGLVMTEWIFQWMEVNHGKRHQLRA